MSLNVGILLKQSLTSTSQRVDCLHEFDKYFSRGERERGRSHLRRNVTLKSALGHQGPEQYFDVQDFNSLYSLLLNWWHENRGENKIINHYYIAPVNVIANNVCAKTTLQIISIEIKLLWVQNGEFNRLIITKAPVMGEGGGYQVYPKLNPRLNF